jgi:DNA-binding LytR/AlgR family response regulator
MIKVLVVDDEPHARDYLKRMLSKYEFEIVGEASNGKEAVEIFLEKSPDVIFLDIEMPGISGLEVVERIGKKALIIFVTAYDDYAIKAFEEGAIDYILKPISKERLDIAVKRIEERLKWRNIPDYEELLRKIRKRIGIKTEDRIVTICVDEIYFIEGLGKISYIHLRDRKILAKKILGYFEDILPKDTFLRVHKSYILNIEKIEELHPMFKGDYIAKLSNGKEIPVSRKNVERVKKILGL